MNRRGAFKRLAVLGGIAFFPGVLYRKLATNPNLHFIGLGSAGTNVLKHIQQKGLEAEYTCMTWFPYFIDPYEGIKHIDYEYPREFRHCGESCIKSIPLSIQMKETLSRNSYYVVICGLGGFTGTSLICATIKFLQRNNKKYMAICTLPFREEGKKRNKYARAKQTELKEYENVYYYDPALTQKKYGDLPASKLFGLVDEELFRILGMKISI